jgi:hypothetical protein
LGARIFTSDREKGKIWAENGLDAGCVFVNDFVKSDPRLPFGGIKESGFGRELSLFGIREFVNIKTIVVKWRCLLCEFDITLKHKIDSEIILLSHHKRHLSHVL